MIHINKSEDIAVEHFNACKPYVEKRLEFVCDFLNALGNKKFVTFSKDDTLNSKYGLEEVTLKTLINPILNNSYKKDGNTYRLSSLQLKSILASDTNCYTHHSDNFFKEAWDFFDGVKKNIETILKGHPTEIHLKYVNDHQKGLQNQYKAIIEGIFRYDTLTDDGFKRISKVNWTSYQLTKALKIDVCPYCNKNWINTVFTNDNKKITNPQLDHYFSKSDYPILRLSFYNLIPSCETCNARIKKAQELDYSKNTHPFEAGFDPFGKVVATAIDVKSAQGLGENYTVNIEFEKEIDDSAKEKIENTFKFFKIKPIYEKHGDIFKEIYFKHQKYGFTYLHELLSDDKFNGMRIEDLYQLIYGNYINVDDYKKRPFAKVTKDTVESLGII